MCRTVGPSGHIEQLSGGCWRAKIRGRQPEIWPRKMCKTEQAVQIDLGKLLAQAAAGRQPDSAVTVAQLLDQCVSTAGWDVSTWESNRCYIRWTTAWPTSPFAISLLAPAVKEQAPGSQP